MKANSHRDAFVIAFCIAAMASFAFGNHAAFFWSIDVNRAKYVKAQFEFKEIRKLNLGYRSSREVAIGVVHGQEEWFYPFDNFEGDIQSGRRSWDVMFNSEASTEMKGGRNIRVIGVDEFAASKRKALLYSACAVVPMACWLVVLIYTIFIGKIEQRDVNEGN